MASASAALALMVVALFSNDVYSFDNKVSSQYIVVSLALAALRGRAV